MCLFHDFIFIFKDKNIPICPFEITSTLLPVGLILFPTERILSFNTFKQAPARALLEDTWLHLLE